MEKDSQSFLKCIISAPFYFGRKGNLMYCEKVRVFTEACSETQLPNEPYKLDGTEILFLTKMVMDEMEELKDAKNVTDQADALVDAIYYICDAACKKGINLDPLFEIVHGANLEKIVDGKVIRREDGKILKPAGWKPPEPQLIKAIEDQVTNGSFN